MPPHEFPTDGTLYVDPRPDMDPALASQLKTLQGKLRDIVSKVTTFQEATTTTNEEDLHPRPRVDGQWRAIVTCCKNVSEWFQKERARIQASTMSADDKTESSRTLDDAATFFKNMVTEALAKVTRAVFKIPENIRVDVSVARRA